MVVTLKIDGANMKAEFREEESDKDAKSSKTQSLSDGFSKDGNTDKLGAAKYEKSTGVTSKQVIGVSGITTPGYFIACGGRGYCGAIVKKEGKNSFEAHITKDNGNSWREI
jgi:hypothetical protein